MIEQCPTCDGPIRPGATMCPKCETAIEFRLTAPDGTLAPPIDWARVALEDGRRRVLADMPEHLRQKEGESGADYALRMRHEAGRLGGIRNGKPRVPMASRSDGPAEVAPKALGARYRFVDRVEHEFRQALTEKGLDEKSVAALVLVLDRVLRRDLGIASSKAQEAAA